MDIIGIHRVVEILCVYFCLWRIYRVRETKTKKLVIVGYVLKKKKSVKEKPAKEIKQECYDMREEPEENDVTKAKERNFKK